MDSVDGTEANQTGNETLKTPVTPSGGQEGLRREKLARSDGTDHIDDILMRLAEMDGLATHGQTSENLIDVETDAVESTYDGLCQKLLDRDRRLGQLGARSYQAIIHHNYTTLRIVELEREVKALKTRVWDLGEDHDFVKRREQLPVHLHELKRSLPHDFELNDDVVRLPTKQQPALEVRLPGGFTQKQVPSQVSLKGETDLHKSGYPSIGEEAPVEATPDRLRIRSRPLMFHLEELTSTLMLSMAGTDRIHGDTVYSSLVFLRPFRFFTQHEISIRQSVAGVEAKLEQESRDNHQDQLVFEDMKKQFSTETLLKDLRLLITFLDTDLNPTLRLLSGIKDASAVEIEYADLRHLFTRGDIVVAGTDRAYARMVVNLAGGRDLLTSKLRDEIKPHQIPIDGFAIDCISLGSNGSSFVPKLEKYSIRKFHGTRSIASLPIYPLKFDSDADSLFTKFKECGEQFAHITSRSFCHKRVVGKTVDEPSISLDAEVIVDMTLAMNAKPEWRSDPQVSADNFTRKDMREVEEMPWCKHIRTYSSCCGSDTIFNDLGLDDDEAEEFLRIKGHMLHPTVYEELTGEHFLIMRPYVHAFVLRSRQWVTVRSEDLQEVVFRNNFDDLVVPDNHKTTVKALVTTHEHARSPHSSSTEQSSIGSALDLVKGKGSGLVILLHGPPGVGKTSTAECVADDTKRPLFPITCGDIGETASDVEHNLQKNFQLAHKWGCVLLLDEADIFLAKRTRSDLRHNAVTSVFLRSLEYYAGILFLTTNRVGAIDPAFRSRIQMSLFYHKLSLDVTCQL